MSGRVVGAISSDIDTLASIYQGRGCRRPGGYTYAEFRMGLEAFDRFLEPYGVQATLFMVGNDFRIPGNHDAIRAMQAAGHEIANHTLTHAQGFRWLSPAQQEAEVAGMEEACERVTGRRPVGFRSPGWNMGDAAAPMLQRRGYLYDSSVHPTVLMPLMKLMHWGTAWRCSPLERTTMGQWSYWRAPAGPYRADRRSLGRRGRDGLLEFPLTVTPRVRLPFFATFLLAGGFDVFRRSLHAIRARGHAIHFMFHLSDFVDYSHADLEGQVPDGRGVYVPQALRTRLGAKLDLFRHAMDLLAPECDFRTLEQWAVTAG